MKNLLSADNLLSLLKLGLPDEGKEEKVRDLDLETVTIWVERDEVEGEIEVAVEIANYEPPGQGGDWDEWLGAQVTLGDAWKLNGESIDLTLEEEKEAQQKFLKILDEREIDRAEQEAAERYDDEKI